MSSVKAYKCPNCKAGLEFIPASQQWKCQYCFSEFTKEQLDLVVEPQATPEPELDSYRCSSCGAELIATSTTSATFCSYCKNHTIIKSRFAGQFQPDRLIPFKLTKDQAKYLYRRWSKRCLFAPDEFKQRSKLEEISGVYAPFWLFDCQVDGTCEGTGTRVRSWTEGEYRYTQTKYYRVLRRGNAAYRQVPVDASQKLDDQLMQLIEPYDYGGLITFSTKYLAGFMAETYDVPASQAEPVMKERVTEYLQERLESTVTGYATYYTDSQRTEFVETTPAYALFPIYLLINQYKGKEYLFIVNGQTGKVAGDAPVSRFKQIRFAVLVFIIVWGVLVFGGALFA